jgi:hypothetical protein
MSSLKGPFLKEGTRATTPAARCPLGCLLFKKEAMMISEVLVGNALCFMDHVVNNAMQEEVVEEDRWGPVNDRQLR